MKALAIDLTDLPDVDDRNAVDRDPTEGPEETPPPPMTFVIVVDDEEYGSPGHLVAKMVSDHVLSPPEVPVGIDPEALSLFHDADDPDTCSVVIEDKEDKPAAGQVPEPAAPSAHVCAFNGGRYKNFAPSSLFASMANEASLHTFRRHRHHLVGPPLDAVQMFLRSQIPEGERTTQPDCAAAIIKAHHDLRFWGALLEDRRFRGHVSDFVDDFKRLRKHQPDASRAALWPIWKQAHDQILAHLPEEHRLVI